MPLILLGILRVQVPRLAATAARIVVDRCSVADPAYHDALRSRCGDRETTARSEKIMGFRFPGYVVELGVHLARR